MNNPKECVKAIKAALAYTGHTQEELARKIGVSPDTLKRRFSNPGRFTLDELAAADRAVMWSAFLNGGVK